MSWIITYLKYINLNCYDKEKKIVETMYVELHNFLINYYIELLNIHLYKSI